MKCCNATESISEIVYGSGSEISVKTVSCGELCHLW
jgi:hypothetical protein